MLPMRVQDKSKFCLSTGLLASAIPSPLWCIPIKDAFLGIYAEQMPSVETVLHVGVQILPVNEQAGFEKVQAFYGREEEWRKPVPVRAPLPQPQ